MYELAVTHISMLARVQKTPNASQFALNWCYSAVGLWSGDHMPVYSIPESITHCFIQLFI